MVTYLISPLLCITGLHVFLISVELFGNALGQNILYDALGVNNIPEDQVRFYLYNRANPGYPIRLVPDTLKELHPEVEVKFLIHGYFENYGSEWYRDITHEYLKKGDYNVVQVDWSKPASTLYTASSSNTQGVGRLLGAFIVNLHNNYNLSLDKVHLIGHSLGAQVSSAAGRHVIKLTGSPISRITALDAAGPLFEGPTKMFKGLKKGDAALVDAIHTDSGIFGCKNKIADVDFYPNGGKAPQPGCTVLQIVLSRSIVEMQQTVFCSHTKSYYYFVASINQESFIGQKCTSWKDYQGGKCRNGSTAVMGANYVFTNNTTGSFFLKTNAAAPFTKNVPTN